MFSKETLRPFRIAFDSIRHLFCVESYDYFLLGYFKTNTEEMNTYYVLATTCNTQLLEGSKLQVYCDEDDGV